jgi:hypothetical protein
VVGVWTGSVRTVAGDTPIEFEIAANGHLKARIGPRTDVGTARVSTISGRLLVRIPGDLEAPNPAGMGRQMSFYLRRRGAGFGGHVTTRPPSATGLDGSVTVYNLLDKEYGDPVSFQDLQPIDTVLQDGRSFRVKLTYAF